MSNRINYNSIPTDGLVGQFLLNGNAVDDYGTNGTATNVSWVGAEKGYVQQVGSFNGSSSYIKASGVSLFGNTFSENLFFKKKANVNYASIISYSLQASPYANAVHCYYDALTDNINFQLRDNVGTIFKQYKSSFTYGIGEVCMLTITWDGTNLKTYKNGVEDTAMTKSTDIAGTITNSSRDLVLGRSALEALYFFNGEMGLVRAYDYALSESEIHNLYLEGQRLLGDTAKYPELLKGLVGYIRAEDGGTVLYDIENGTIPTYVGGTATTDNLGNNKAIINPNYTWTSITYTTGYTFENSGAGWSIVASPTGLSSTGINRTTTLRDVYLFNRTLSTDEVNTLEALCNYTYPYPFGKSSTLNLQDGLVMHLDSAGNDLSGNGNNGTPTNVTKVRKNQSEGGSYNGSTSLITVSDSTSLDITGTVSLNAKIELTSAVAYAGVMYKGIDNGTIEQNYTLDMGADGLTPRFGFYNGGFKIFQSDKSITTGKIYSLGVRHTSGNGANTKFYINGVEVSGTWTLGTGNETVIANNQNLVIGDLNKATGTYNLNGKIYEPKVWDRGLTAKEFEQEHYLTYLN